MTRRRTEAERIRAQYGDRFVPAPADLPPAAQEVGVTIDALVRLADRCGGIVAHLVDPWTGTEVYFLDTGGVRYRSRAEGRPVPRGRRVTV